MLHDPRPGYLWKRIVLQQSQKTKIASQEGDVSVLAKEKRQRRMYEFSTRSGLYESEAEALIGDWRKYVSKYGAACQVSNERVVKQRSGSFYEMRLKLTLKGTEAFCDKAQTDLEWYAACQSGALLPL